MNSKSAIKVRKVESLVQQLRDVEDRIRIRAYDRFVQRGCQPGDEAEDWRNASADLIAQPPIALSEMDGRFLIMFSVSVVALKDLELLITDNALLLQSTLQPLMDIPGIVHICEFQPRQLFRFVELPRRIDPRSIKVECEGGLCRVTAKFADASPLKPQLKAKATKPKPGAKIKSRSRLAEDVRV